jgi:hypothetical protein
LQQVLEQVLEQALRQRVLEQALRQWVLEQPAQVQELGLQQPAQVQEQLLARHQRLRQLQLLSQQAQCRLQEPESPSAFPKSVMVLRCPLCQSKLQTMAHRQQQCRQLF